MNLVKFAFVLLLFCSTDVFASKISGVVSDVSNNELLIGAYVQLKSSQSGKSYQSVTGLDGSYSFSNVPAGDYSLEINFIGYLPLVFPVSVSQNADINLENKLEQDNQMLSGVVILAEGGGTDAHARNL